MPPVLTEPEGSEATAVLGGQVTLLQPIKGFRVAIDSLLLAAAAAPPERAQVLDAGCGVGAAALCLLNRRPDLTLLGLESQPELAALATSNARTNRQEAHFSALCCDLARLPAQVRARSFDWAISNPPYFAEGKGGASPMDGKSQANQEGALDLEGWLDAILRRLVPGGGLTLVHRADRLPDLLAALQARCGAITILPLWPKAGQPAKRVIVAARKTARSPARLLPGLVLHEADGSFTASAEAILRDSAPLSLDPEVPPHTNP